MFAFPLEEPVNILKSKTLLKKTFSYTWTLAECRTDTLEFLTQTATFEA